MQTICLASDEITAGVAHFQDYLSAVLTGTPFEVHAYGDPFDMIPGAALWCEKTVTRRPSAIASIVADATALPVDTVRIVIECISGTGGIEAGIARSPTYLPFRPYVDHASEA